MIYKGYIGRAAFDEEEKTIRGRVVNLRRDGIDFEAERADQIEDQFRTSVDEYLAFCREHDRDPEAPLLEHSSPPAEWALALAQNLSGVDFAEVVAQAAVSLASASEALVRLTAANLGGHSIAASERDVSDLRSFTPDLMEMARIVEQIRSLERHGREREPVR